MVVLAGIVSRGEMDQADRLRLGSSAGAGDACHGDAEMCVGAVEDALGHRPRDLFADRAGTCGRAGSLRPMRLPFGHELGLPEFTFIDASARIMPGRHRGNMTSLPRF